MVRVRGYGRPPGRHAGKLVHLEAIHQGKATRPVIQADVRSPKH
jgi:hypothetical protein